MTRKKSVLFVCIHNSARSQMAEAFLRAFGGDSFSVESAGLEAGSLHPLAVASMREIGIDISGQTSSVVDDLIRQGRQFDYVITVCDESSGQQCPIFPGTSERLHWNFDDPATLTLSGCDEEKQEKVRRIREQIRQKISFFLQE